MADRPATFYRISLVSQTATQEPAPVSRLSVAAVEPVMPVAQAGIEQGDMLTSMDGAAIDGDTILHVNCCGMGKGTWFRLP